MNEDFEIKITDIKSKLDTIKQTFGRESNRNVIGDNSLLYLSITVARTLLVATCKTIRATTTRLKIEKITTNIKALILQEIIYT